MTYEDIMDLEDRASSLAVALNRAERAWRSSRSMVRTKAYYVAKELYDVAFVNLEKARGIYETEKVITDIKEAQAIKAAEEYANPCFNF